jgi:DNA helicase-2/ATP-dependent DNA helicase PcrA
VVDQALAHKQGAIALITYTRNNIREIHLKTHDRIAAIPSHVEIISWYSFLLRELARPYRAVLHNRRIDGISWSEGKSVPFVPEFKTSQHYFHNGSRVYSDKISKFICECERASNGAVMRRLSQRFSHIIIDEIQDMAAYDLDVLELILKSGIQTTLVGDHRQATFATNNAPKHKAFAGTNIIKKFEIWRKAGLTSIEYKCHTYRCNQAIADFADGFFPNEPKTISYNNSVTGHDGVFLVSAADAAEYIQRFSPQVLRYSARTNCAPFEAMNFGESKGLTFERVLIYPHGPAQKWLASGKLADVEKSAAKMYVATTRARYSVAFVFDGKTCGVTATRWVR